MDDQEDSGQAEELKALRRELAHLRGQAEERHRREENLRQSGLPRKFSAAEVEYRLAKKKHGLDAAETEAAQRRLLGLTIEMLRASQNFVRGMQMLALATAANALTDAVVRRTPWASMAGHAARNRTPYRRLWAINVGLSYIATAEAGHIEVEGAPGRNILAAAKAKVADIYKVTPKSVTRWWNEAKAEGNIGSLVISPEEFMNLPEYAHQDDRRSAREHLKNHLVGLMEDNVGNMKKGAGH